MEKIKLKKGDRFNRWTVINEQPIFKGKKNQSHYECECDCGTIRYVSSYGLRKEKSKSCGCYVKDIMSQTKRKDIQGLKVGKLTVIKRVKDVDTGHSNKWLCQCECGNQVTVATGTLTRNNQMSCGCIRKGNQSHMWKGGRINNNGYVMIYNPEHPKSNPNGYVREHRLVMEKKLGRILHDDEQIHHKNGIRDDNRIENLELWVKSQPTGKRVDDMIDFCYNFLKIYKSELLK